MFILYLRRVNMSHNDVVKSVSIRIPESLLIELRNVAEYEGRSINSQVVYLIRQCVKNFRIENNG